MNRRKSCHDLRKLEFKGGQASAILRIQAFVPLLEFTVAGGREWEPESFFVSSLGHKQNAAAYRLSLPCRGSGQSARAGLLQGLALFTVE